MSAGPAEALDTTDLKLTAPIIDPPIEFVDFEKYRDNIPPIDWLIEGVLARGEIVVFSAKPKSGKTTTQTHMGLHLAEGLPWMGLKVPKACRVMIFDEEQGLNTTLRQGLRVARGIGEGVGPWNGPDWHYQTCVGSGIEIVSESGLRRLESIVATHRPDVIFLDSMSKIIAGEDENANLRIAELNKGLLRMRLKYDVAIVLTHHVVKLAMKGRTRPEDRMALMRGASEITGNADAGWWLERTDDDNVEFSVTFRRETESDETIAFLIDRQSDGTRTGPIHLNRVDGPIYSPEEQSKEQRARAIQLEALAKAPESMSTGELDEVVAEAGAGSESTADRARRWLSNQSRQYIERVSKGVFRITEAGRRELAKSHDDESSSLQSPESPPDPRGQG